jgi:3-methyladenine DNA glycosylase AlkD
MVHKSDKRTSLAALKRALTRVADPERARDPIWFKTGKGDYGEGDKFIGVRIPTLRAIAKQYESLGLIDIEYLLQSAIHEYRYIGVLILVSRYETGNGVIRQQVFRFYIDHIRCVNNWDLVDTSAPNILGEHIVQRSRRILYRLAGSAVLWDRRIAMVATLALIQRGDLRDTFGVAKRLLADKHDLIHKAVGWMLREAGDQSRSQLIRFLKQHYSRMPRTALRYAIEHLSTIERRRALKGLFDV